MKDTIAETVGAFARLAVLDGPKTAKQAEEAEAAAAAIAAEESAAYERSQRAREVDPDKD